MLRYAREDTHYLLYVYDVLVKELVEKGLKANSQNPF
jgi:ribonuclease D